ncbi:helix-turn-helix transcriptional regulator [Cryobacterium sp. RTC2.1]|uniref:helix-turn-helix domain-containing protein n=1 Tax=Cryobacterium sp. RTC2.1 TaxID=3048634 RepID=UPI002B2222CE|nr:helix-turn-helix transcriptional regulator [Cryobacterium sp. RTC2.1]MEB0001469.1 helix-turn-helix transcriptional regulator [Cryobacterium sp. RTC2.1]
MTTRRKLDYNWNLRGLMAAHNLWKTTDLAPLLRDRGINLSAAQVYRLVAEKPERLSLRTLVALCDIFDCSPNELVEPFVQTAEHRKAVNSAEVIDISTEKRPVRAQIVPDK